ncbi:hypothetical protein HZ326_8773 [Fusarium oxysporum f. sp. albedinis]|nr:hypothetical protein HZ326_8773 [Fusarium oxysporum f. sp. albedinis]
MTPSQRFGTLLDQHPQGVQQSSIDCPALHPSPPREANPQQLVLRPHPSAQSSPPGQREQRRATGQGGILMEPISNESP